MLRPFTVTAALAALLALPSIAHAAADGVIRESVAACDPNSPTHCAAPDANGAVPTRAGALTPLGYQQITSLNAATSLTIPSTSTMAVVEVKSTGTNVRWRDDGTDPTSTIGMELVSGTIIQFTTTLSALKFIETGASAELNISYYR